MKGVIVKFDYWLKNMSIHFLKWVLFAYTQKFKKGNILIFRTGSIGDSICAFPAISAIREKFPDSKISLLTNPAGKNVSMDYLLDPRLEITIVNYLGLGFGQLIRLLRSGKYDLFIELPQTHATWKTNIRNMLIARFIGARFGFGWQVYASSLFKTHQEKHNSFLPETERLLEILKTEGIGAKEPHFPLAFTEIGKENVTNFLKINGLQDRTKNIAIVAGAKRSTNQWPTEYFNEIITDLSKRGYSMVLIGGKDDHGKNERLFALPNVYNAVGHFAPIESALLMSHCALVISNDTGPLHLSYAVGTPVLGIYSARDYPKQWYPPGFVKHKVLREMDVPCAICLLEECPNKVICLHCIKPAQVLSAVEELLS